MADVKAERIPYRQRQARETKRLIARAARSLFSRHGYAATSIEAVAQEAGVSPRTVYAAFGTKKAILGAICDEWLAEAGVVEAITAAAAEPMLAARLPILAHASRRQWESDRGVRSLLEGAAAADAEVARMLAGWKDGRAGALRAALAGVEGQLRPALDADRAAGVLRALTGAEVYAELVAGEGWSPDGYEEWLREALAELLLPRTGQPSGARARARTER
jgi:AcrR family transcriptional regulator